MQLFLHALGYKDIAIKLRAAMGVSQQLAGLQQDVNALRSELASKDARIESLQKKVDAIESSSWMSWSNTRVETLCACPG